MPPLPKAGKDGNMPAVAFGRASLTRKIMRARLDLGMSQKELAARAGVRMETLCRIDTGKHTASVPTVEKIDRALKKAAKEA